MFLACSFRMAKALKAIGRVRNARTQSALLHTMSNDSGLFSEEDDVERGRLVGNIPQAFSHIALVTAAFDLANEPDVRCRVHRNSHC